MTRGTRHGQAKAEILAALERWPDWSGPRLARLLNVSHRLVLRYRRERYGMPSPDALVIGVDDRLHFATRRDRRPTSDE
jgi:hypothetical protein